MISGSITSLRLHVLLDPVPAQRGATPPAGPIVIQAAVRHAPAGRDLDWTGTVTIS